MSEVSLVLAVFLRREYQMLSAALMKDNAVYG
jgi:hypothetical protein